MRKYLLAIAVAMGAYGVGTAQIMSGSRAAKVDDVKPFEMPMPTPIEVPKQRQAPVVRYSIPNQTQEVETPQSLKQRYRAYDDQLFYVKPDPYSNPNNDAAIELGFIKDIKMAIRKNKIRKNIANPSSTVVDITNTMMNFIRLRVKCGKNEWVEYDMVPLQSGLMLMCPNPKHTMKLALVSKHGQQIYTLKGRSVVGVTFDPDTGKYSLF